MALDDTVRYLVFPLIVLLAGVLITGVLLPSWTRRRDDHRRALEVKTQLVTDMSEAVTELVTAIRFAAQAAADKPRVTQTPEEYENAYKLWEKRRAALGTKLEAYFPKTPERNVEVEWRGFVGCMRQFYELIRDNTDERKNDLEDRANALRDETIKLLTESQDDPAQYNRSKVVNDSYERIEMGDTLEQIEAKLEQPIYRRKGELISRIMKWRLDGLEGPPPIFARALSRIRKWVSIMNRRHSRLPTADTPSSKTSSHKS